MEHGEATAIARRMITEMGDPTGRYGEVELATGLQYSTLKVITHRLRNSGEISKQTHKAKTKSDMARQMLIERIGMPPEYDAIARATGLLVTSIRGIAAMMRKDGLLPAYNPDAYEYVGSSDKLGVVRFKSLSKAQEQGFHSCMVSKAVNGIIDSYAGYKWERVYK